MSTPCCPSKQTKKKPDYFFWGFLFIVTIGYVSYFLHFLQEVTWFHHLSHGIFELMNKMWLGLGLGIVFVGILSKVPRTFVLSIIGKPGTIKGLFRATLAGVFLDLCSHGILMVGMKLYERGASLGQMMAFLIASPWNSFSLTVILISLIGFKATLLFIALSCVIAIVSGIIFDRFEKSGVLPSNPNTIDLPKDFQFLPEVKKGFKQTQFNLSFFRDLLVSGFKDSRMIIRWILIGVVLASLIRTFVPIETFQTWFGPTLAGLGLTLLFATIIEVCSEGSTPIAADIVTRADALGNGFTFLMAGVATDYTEIMVIREQTRSWKIALFLPLVTLPQVLVFGYLLNQM